jgi:FHA domain
MRVTTSSVTDDTVGFDGLRAVVGAGDGVVGRFPGIVCVARCSDPEPLRQFLSVCAEVAGPEPGRALARRLATWMSGPDAPGHELRFGTIAAAGDKLAVYLVGEVGARVDAVGGLSLSGAHAAIGTDRLLPPPTSPVVLSMDGGDVRADPADVHDLRAGVVPGAGVVLRPTGFGLDDLGRAEGGARGVHEWFDTGEGASDPFADPPRAADLPVQRAAGVRVGGRNGVAREAGPEASAEADPAEDAVASQDGGPAAGPGRHALDMPVAPPQTHGPHVDPAAGDRSIDPLTDPLPDFRAADPDDPLGVDGHGYPPHHESAPPQAERSAPAEPRADLGLETRRPRPFGGQRPPAFADPAAPVTDPPSPPSTGQGRMDAGAQPAGPAPLDGSRSATSARDEDVGPGPRPATSAGRAMGEGAPLDGSPLLARALGEGGPFDGSQPRPSGGAAGAEGAAFDGSALGHTPEENAAPFGRPPQAEEAQRDTLPVRGRQPGRPRPGEPPAAASLFAPAHDPARGSVIDLAPVATPPAGFAPPPSRAPETRPPPPTDGSTTTTPSSLFERSDEATPTTERRGPRIRGYSCENGHLNDPRSPSCRECAAPIDERVGGLVAGPRPPLGRLVFDDGAAHVVDGSYLVGGRPDTDERVRAGELRPIVVDDESVAHAHAEIRVSGWDVMVVDAGSHNGTYVSGPDEGRWTPLPPRRSRRLLPGTRVRLGDGRTFVFESSSTVR